MKKILVILIICLGAVSLQCAEKKGRLHVIVKGLKSSDGWVVCHLFNGPDGYPTKSKKALKWIDDFNIKNGQAEFYFDNLPYGDYAFTVHHDENGNKKMDTNILGLPNEGWACSKNVTGILGIGPPSFDAAKFSVNQSEVEQIVTIKY